MSYVNSGNYDGSRDIQSQCNGLLLKKGDIDILCTFEINFIDQLVCLPHTYLRLLVGED